MQGPITPGLQCPSGVVVRLLLHGWEWGSLGAPTLSTPFAWCGVPCVGMGWVWR